MHSRSLRARPIVAPAATLLAALVVTLSGCAASDPVGQTSSSSPDPGHGAIAGATELAEPQLGLTSVDPAGHVTHLDLLDESVTQVGSIGSPTALATDGRYLFATTATGVDIVDSGVWTWDHIDHFHYYRAEARIVGTLRGEGPANVATTNLSTTGGTGVFFADSGEGVLLETAALSRGRISELFRVTGDPHRGMVVPIGSYALVTEARGGVPMSVAVYSMDGERTGLEEPCANASGTITTRVGAVIGCDDGALLATMQDGELSIERIPYPDGAGAGAPAATVFANREGRPTVAGLGGDRAIWTLDTRERSWTLLPAPAPLVHVTAVDDDRAHLLALTTDGRVLVLNGVDGTMLSQTAPLVADSLAAGLAPVLIADQQRAYLSAPFEGRLYEIDYADDARIARTFETTTQPTFVAETGR